MNWFIVRILFFLFFFIFSFSNRLEEGFEKRLSGISQYEIVQPVKIGTKRIADEVYPYAVALEFTFRDQTFKLNLIKNTELLLPNYKHVYMTYENSKLIRTREEVLTDHCFYKGMVNGDPKSIVSISTCNGITGIINTSKEKLIIEPHITRMKRMNSNDHIVYRDIDNHIPHGACGVKDDHHHETHSNDVDENQGKASRSITTDKAIEILVVNDKLRFDQFTSNTQTNALTIMNIVNQYFNNNNLSPSNSAAVIGMVTFESSDPWTADRIGSEVDVEDLLDRFRNWRNTNSGVLPSHDNAVLLSGDDFDGNTVGLAYVGTLCVSGGTSSCNVNMALSTQNINNIASTVAHEIGHNLNMRHDGTSEAPSCPSTGFIMEAISGGTARTEFSSCSKTTYTSFMVGKTCMDNIPTELFGGVVCGDGFTSPGEQCDCGPGGCTGSCCNETTCQLVSGAQCFDGDPCCNNDCTLKAQGTVCRSVNNPDCDIEDVCSGTSPLCPDIHQPTGTGCGTEGLCWLGVCFSYEAACQSYGFVKCTESERQSLTGGKNCDRLVCKQNSGSPCSFLSSGGVQIKVPNGIPCTTNFVNPLQCLDGSCVGPQGLDGNCTAIKCETRECGNIDNQCGNPSESCGSCESPQKCSNNGRCTVDPKKLVGCFIATAAYNSPMDPHVWKLRVFRDQYLHGNFFGEKFIEFYYHYSPEVANWIAQHEWAKTFTRTLLWPILSIIEIFFN